MGKLVIILAISIVALVVLTSGCAQEKKEGNTEMKLKISSLFEHNSNIPSKYTCDGENVNPPLHIENIPAGTKSLAIIIDDPDAPSGTWVHWVVFNIKPTSAIKEDNVPGTEGINDFKQNAYGGPCPPSGTHRYFFKVYALDTELALNNNAKKSDIEKAMKNHILAQGELVGLYSRA